MRKSICTFLALSCLAFTVPAMSGTNDYNNYNNNNAMREVVSRTVSVSFGESSTRFRPGPVAKVMLETALDASMITINGRTSTNKPSKRDENLALARAVSARNYLVAQGVSPLKIMINYVSADDYLTENWTPEGRRINQRVDIEMIYVPTY
ncbi:OmpA family protein [Vibrio sp. 1733]|uniref:IncQ plasmid conjugative transfer protein TraP n=3 Tax=Vibrionales TaxID=135623 RepID=A0A510BP00_VIBAL|nr:MULTISPECIES: OmpA family protein [Pseudomonadota]AXQ85547.1 IncQ plasmid conjugative transfer protein TraP [Vibrio alginolyticus]HCH1007475.1 OmpA family protein [Vibrio parahaemolyticus]MBU2889930.1 OmpA family protein [Celeribacter halophilus]MBU2952755.1 OmpA family protein [Marinobacter sp. F3R08]MDW1593723.1 OmpA family protein [Vibrio sp. Vb2944]